MVEALARLSTRGCCESLVGLFGCFGVVRAGSRLLTQCDPDGLGFPPPGAGGGFAQATMPPLPLTRAQ